MIGPHVVKTIVCTDVQPVFIYLLRKSRYWWMELCSESDAIFISFFVGITCQGFGSCEMRHAVDLFRKYFVRTAPG